MASTYNNFSKTDKEYKKAMDIQKRLQELLTEVGKMVPTLLVVGMTADKHGALVMGSPEEDNKKRTIDLCAAIAMTMEQKQELREVIFLAVSWFMQNNPKYRDVMLLALKKMEELDEHQGH